MGLDGFHRREFLKAALATGGMGALSACVDVEGHPQSEVPRGDPSSVPERQFAWNDFMATGMHGNPLIPNHQLLLFLRYPKDGEPTPDDREQVETAFRSIERAYQWGTGGTYDAESTDGILFFIGYAPRYFERFDADLSTDVIPMPPEELIDRLSEDAEPDSADAVVVLNSGRASVLLSTEEALRGRFDELNGVSVESALTDVFDVVERRTGFLGAGRPSREFDVDIPDISPTGMGFRSGFSDNQASENQVAIKSQRFWDGSMLQVSRLVLDLESWYELERSERVNRMFSPEHTPEQVGDIGEHLGGRSRISKETVDRRLADAEEHGMVGHTQKVAAARDDDFNPKILRRSEGLSTDLEEPAMNFSSLQPSIEQFIEVREAMNCAAEDNTFTQGDDENGTGERGSDVSGCPVHVDEENDGILSFMETLSRGTYLVPPRSKRALPRVEA